MEINGSIKWDVSVEEGLSAQSDEVTAHGEEHVREQKGDGGSRATREGNAHHRGLREACSFSLKSVV